MDPSDIGRFGTLSLLRRLPLESVVTSYPIDDEELTIGRDQSCSLRLYYPAVSALHAKITFVERKAFLVVLGTNGLLLDDAPLFPAAAHAPGPTTVPLQNNSVIEIHKKRFKFSYPPKHLRPALINTPSRATPMPSRRPLRLSMIASAHVFTPGPSPNPEENLRVLQSPLRTPFAQDEEEIVLVHSNTPRVVEEDKDLVILDEVEPEPVLPLPLPVAPQAPRTPVRRAPRPSLHRAVLIRSAQRAAIQREIQMEEEQEVEEVEETIAAIAEADEGEEDVQEVPPPGNQRQPTGWRKSLDLVKGGLGWAFRGLSVEPKEEEEEATMQEAEEQDEQYGEEYEEDMEADDMDENYDEREHDHYDEDPAPEQDDEPAEPLRPLGRFMTPQIPRTMSAKAGRLSLGAGPDAGARRVRLVEPWKVNEIQVPNSVKEEGHTERSTGTPAALSTPRLQAKREKLTEEEREAIRARRRSALATPDNFFKGQTPGSRRTLFPSLAPLPSPSFTSQPSEPASSASQSQPQPASVQEETPPAATSSSVKAEDDDEKEDTAVLLARMRQMVEGVKQRKSLGRQSLNPSPRKRDGGFSLLAPGHATAHAPSRILIDDDDDAPQDPARQQPATPQMSDLRHVFGRAHAHAAESSTPALAGVRDMFRAQPQGPAETPRMDGVREMLGTPAGYRQASPERRTTRGEPAQPDIEDEREEEEKEEKEKEDPVEPLPTRGTRGRKAPGASRIARRTPAQVPQSAPAKSTRAASQAVEEPEPAESGAADDARTVRRTRARTADGDVGQIPRATRGKAAEKKPATPEPAEDDDDGPAPKAAPRGTRRTRQATDSSTSSHTTDDAAAAAADTKPARKTRAKTPTASAAKPTAARRGTRAKPIEVPEEDGEDDPLDSLPRDGTPAAEEQPPPPPARARRGTRSKIPVGGGGVKQEDVEPSLTPADEAGTRTTRARRTPVPRQPTPSGGRGGTTRARAAAPTAAGAAASAGGAEGAIPEDKENTPEPGEGDEAEEAKAAAAAPAARVRAGAKGARKGAGKAEPAAGEESVPPPPAGAKTRAGRARAARA